MIKLIYTKGVSGSGKSFWAKQYVAQNKNTVIICRDDIRLMLQPGYQFGNWKLEDVVTDISVAAVESSLKNGLSVIICDTNLSDRSINKWKSIADSFNKEKLTVKLEEKSFLDVPLEICIERDRKRGLVDNMPWVGENVIMEQALRSGVIKKEKCVLVDLDGTLCDISNRRKESQMENGKINFDRFHDISLLETDLPRTDIIDFVNKFKEENNCKMVIVSGRSSATNKDNDKCRILNWSKDWLVKNGVNFDHILMRKQKDSRSDVDVKRDFLKLVGKENVLLAVDDRRQVCDFWKSEGINLKIVDPNDPINGGDF